VSSESDKVRFLKGLAFEIRRKRPAEERSMTVSNRKARRQA